MTSQIYSSCSYCRAWTIHPDHPRNTREPHVHSPRDADSDHQEWMVTRNERDLHPSSHNTNPPYPLGQSSAREEAFHYRGSCLATYTAKGKKKKFLHLDRHPWRVQINRDPSSSAQQHQLPKCRRLLVFLFSCCWAYVSWQKLNHVEREFYCRTDSD